MRFHCFSFPRPDLFASRGAARYLAVLLGVHDSIPVIVDLGGCAEIDSMVSHLRFAITGVEETGVEGSAQFNESWQAAADQLRGELYDPIEQHVQHARALVFAPDAQLFLLPFELMAFADGDLLRDKYHISYATAGRDVLNWSENVCPSSQAVVVCNPHFGSASVKSSNPSSSSPFQRPFESLPGTAVEGKEVARLLSVDPLEGADASEAAIRGVQHPAVLHLATHGFFIGPMESERGPNDESRARVSPLFESGLVLAGANELGAGLSSELGKGFLTAEDVVDMQLDGTELVVLSACQTGLGGIRSGEGVMGLRRAFAIAGARTIVMSLWNVPDESTALLMCEMYKGLREGAGRVTALRDAQDVVRRSYSHPRNWAGFVCAGDPAPLRDEIHQWIADRQHTA